MILANYQFTDMIGATFRYAHVNADVLGVGSDSDKITLAYSLVLPRTLT